MKEQLLQIAEYIASLEARIAALETRSAELEARLQEACAQCEQIAALEARIAELENTPASASTSEEEPEIEVEFEFADDLQPDDDTPNGYDGLQPDATSQPLDERSGLDLLEPLAQSPLPTEASDDVALSSQSLNSVTTVAPAGPRGTGLGVPRQAGETNSRKGEYLTGVVVEELQTTDAESPASEPETEPQASIEPEPTVSEPEEPAHRGPVQTSLFGAPVNDIRHAISLGDRFLFQRELFAGNGEQMQKTLDEINALRSYKDAVAYIERFGWDTESSTYELFLNVLRRRF